MVKNSPDSTFLLVTANVTLSTVAGTVTQASITDDPVITGVQRFLIPTGQTWVFEDLYISSSSGAGVNSNPVVYIYKGGGRIMAKTPPLSDLLVSNSSRPPYSNKKVGFYGGETLSIQVVNTATAVSSANESISFRIRVSVT